MRIRGFNWAMVAMLALGIGATTAMFTVVNGVLLRPLALRDPGQVVLLGEVIPQQAAASEKFAYIDTPSAFFAWQKQAGDFAALAAISSSSFTLANAGRPQLLHGAHVSWNFFAMLGVPAQLGRTLVASDEGNGARPMVITDQLWRTAFGADPHILGRRIGAPGTMATVVGVLPASFRLSGRGLGPMLSGEPTQYFDALKFHAGPYQVFSDFNYSVMGRLRPGISLEQARAQSDVILANLARTSPDKLGLTTLITTVQDYTVQEAQQELWLLLAGVAAVLLIVCVNLGGLWVTRIADRRRDWAIRAALGAAPGRLARQVLGESMVLALVGGGLGILCAALSLRAIVAAAPADIPRLDQVHMDWRVLAFGLGLSLLAGLLTGLVPALRLASADPQATLKAASGSTTADRSSLRSRQMLIALQAALSTLLLAAAGLIGLSFYRLVSQNAGFSTDRALAADITLNVYTDEQRDRILTQLPAAVASLPGVTAAAETSHLPLLGETWVDGIGIPGKVVPASQSLSANVRFVSPGYFAAMNIPLLAGRDLQASDRPAGWPPKDDKAEAAMSERVVVSAETVHLLWPGTLARDAIGRKILFNGGTTPVIVGVAADVRASLTALPPAVVYTPYWTQPPYHFALVLRSPLPADALAAPVREAIWKLAPAAPVPTLRPLADLKADAVAPQRYQLTLLLLFAGLALLLAAMGVYALVGHSVARRSKELAIRLVLGASGGGIWNMVVRQALAPVVGGVVAGVALAVFGGQVLASLLFQVSPSSPFVLMVVASAVLAAALLACLPPARRATRTDPVGALRAE